MTKKQECLAVAPGENRDLATGRAERIARRRVATPAVDIAERAEGVVVRADLPGVKPEGVEVVVDRDVLTLKGRSSLEAPEGLPWVHREFAAVDYERTFTLGRDVDREGVRATLANGVLEVFLPKVTAARARRVEVRAS